MNRKRTKPFTPAQLSHQAKFSCVAKFIHSITALLKITYPKTDLLTGTNQALLVNVTTAVTLMPVPALVPSPVAIMVPPSKSSKGSAASPHKHCCLSDSSNSISRILLVYK